jgi:hypothetical protein
MFATPTGALFLKGSQQQRKKLFAKLDTAADDQQE